MKFGDSHGGAWLLTNSSAHIKSTTGPQSIPLQPAAIFILTAADAAGNTFERSYRLVVANGGGLFVTSTNPSDTWLGRGRPLFTLNTNGTSTYTWSLVDGMMPPGAAL